MTGESVPLAWDAFVELISGRARDLLLGAQHVRSAGGTRACFTRPLLHGLLSGAAELEELLDAYGAARNRRWYPFRRAVATTKLFSQVAYHLEHLLLFLPTYRLRPVAGDFRGDTESALGEVCRILALSLDAMIATGRLCGLTPLSAAPLPSVYAEHLPPGRLPADRMSNKVTSSEQTVASLSTAFLNLSEDSRFLHATQETDAEPAGGWIPDPINEAALRELEQRFHSLQSLYDTHISDTNVETLDPDLPVLRGHIAVTFHLLQVSTRLVHYAERHILGQSPHVGSGGIVDHAAILGLLVKYSLAYASRYILAARGLCHEMLKRYAIPDVVTLPIPKYRGFHVRPSTMLARIVAHYGGEVTMELDEEIYNVGFTLDLFRANEKINAAKRRHLAREVHGRLGGETPADAAIEELVREVAQRLFAEGRLVIYDRTLALEGFAPREAESPVERVIRALTLLLSMGKVDVEMEIRATFRGDRRVLEDIRLLAESRYGEDDFGNNLPLPARLSYLRK